MSVITEIALRKEFKDKIPEKYFVNSNTIITPSAKQYLREKNIELVSEEEYKKAESSIEPLQHKAEETKEKLFKYVSFYSGASFEKKPEYMTHIYGNKLVFKDNPRIILRGKLDSFQSKVLGFQIVFSSKNEEKLVKELEEILNFTRNILRADVLGEDFEDVELLGLNQEQLREMSHYPDKYFGVPHILPDYNMGEVIIKLNDLRSSAREIELAAVTAYRKDYSIERLDLIKALNRLSSCIYIMMCKYEAGLYK
ncbi:MAG: cobalamin adenosyltransferase [Bacteroidetes bacterium 4572_77]|nr:MAG: cobalamin adenosyltransferase [Bacteroidetes bacterium 4572_77]